MDSPFPLTDQPPTSPNPNDGSEPIVCNACKQGLEETEDNTVVSFGKYLFHRCAKCHNLVEHDTNLLLLSDGSPVCENCSYICSVCSKPIHNEAIVTGDESYHAECFRCRSCSNKIEELIFAKTTQGIWCMSCHNERVARTRKHAEAKRSRGASRKEKSTTGDGSSSGVGTGSSGSTKSSSRSKSEREHRERERDREKSKDSQNSHHYHHFESDQPVPSSTTTNESQIPIRPLPPSPMNNGLFASTSSSSDPSASSSHRRIKTTPGDAPRHSPSIDLPPSGSAQSLNTLSSTRSTTPTIHSRTPSNLSAHPYDESSQRSPLNPPSLNSLREPTNRRPSGEHSYFNEQPHSRGIGSTSPELPPHDAFRPAHYDPGALSPKLPLDSSSRQGSLSAPDKSANRRSGFYGRPSTSDDSSTATTTTRTTTTTTAATTIPPESLLSRTPPTSSSTPILPPPPPLHQTPPNASSQFPSSTTTITPTHDSTSSPSAGKLHGSMSFYDPDSLLFLNGIGSNPASPKGGHQDGLDGLPSISIPRTSEGEDEEELLDNEPSSRTPRRQGSTASRTTTTRRRQRPSGDGSSNSGSEGEEDYERDGQGGGGAEVARKVRESIQLAKRESDGQSRVHSSGLDVELVEMLLSELEGTKKEMSALQSKYNAFRRASRSAFEGFSMAREEYDKEVAARRETEQEMKQLRTKFLEQAKRLAQVDQEQKQQETLKRRSKDLRNSVVGMEKHLSQLKAEVALSTAQVAELAALGKDEASTSTTERPTSVQASHDELAEALNARLETVKDVHRDEINGLLAQKDDLVRELSELRQLRDSLSEENAALQLRNADLHEKHTEATRQFDTLQDQTSKLRLLSSPTPNALNGRSGHGHAHTPSSSSLLSNFTSASASGGGGGMNAGRSPLATARMIGSPSELSESFRFAKPEAVEASTRNKFKWGKGKSTTSNNNNDSTSRSMPPPPVPVAKSPTLARQGGGGTVDQKHAFQPVSILRPVRCDYCGDKMWGLNEVRCGLCGSYAHAKCSGYLQGGCGSGGGGNYSSSSNQDDTLNFTPVGPPIFGGDLIVQAKSENREVPLVVTKCISAVEAYGMTYEGIYRKTGGMGQTKLITQHFESKQDFDLQDRDKFNDLAAVTSCMKNYFRSLPNPLFTHELHEEFVAAAELQDLESRLQSLEKALHKLPPIHFQTARLLFQHLHRVQLESSENKMTSANLGVVFGPTVLRSPVAAREWSDMGPKAKIVEILCDHANKLFGPSTSPSGDSGQVQQQSQQPGGGRSLPLPPSDGS
ncbi:uncharacterized protein JCM6883_005728 [Sporobolomyces salmoneus]|uniref:uncharacterized protein n=1 Tax=Sporobolomyces salmoneus TaxID=183962 RepID=UPI0031704C1B